jgi:drug/metabolite transporter (DMT)-like permease
MSKFVQCRKDLKPKCSLGLRLSEKLDSYLIGNSAAILTAFLWTGSSIFFTAGGKRIGFFSVNAYRSAITVGLLAVAHVVLLGYVLPAATGEQWLWMGLSGIVGLGIGDFGLFAAYILIGPRRSWLIMASSPIFTSVSAFLMLGETFPSLAVLGVAVTLLGIVVVILEKENDAKAPTDGGRLKAWGTFAGIVAAAGQGVGLVLSKKGMYVGESVAMNPVSAALIRMMIATAFVWTSAFFLRKMPELRKTAKDKQGLKFVSGGAFIGPFLGMTLSLFAVANTEAGIAQTLLSLEPLIIIPLMWKIYGERTSRRGIIGAVIAVVGVAILMLS